MLIVEPTYFSKFKCLADSCPDNCCKGWEVYVDDDKIKDYSKICGEIGERLRRDIESVEDGEHRIVQRQGKCAFLRRDGLCDIQCNLGQEYLPMTCGLHPRFGEIYGGLQEWNLAISCPEATRLILSDSQLAFNCVRNDDILPPPNQIDAEELAFYKQLREMAFQILRCDGMTVAEKLITLLHLGDDGDEIKKNRDYKSISKLKSKYANYQLIDIHFGYDTRENKLVLFTKRIVGDYEGMEILTQNWRDILHRINGNSAKLLDRENFPGEDGIAERNLAFYIIYKYMLKCIDKYKPSMVMKMAVLFVLTMRIATILGEEEFIVARTIGREIEHCEENLAMLRKKLNSYVRYRSKNLEEIILMTIY